PNEAFAHLLSSTDSTPGITLPIPKAGPARGGWLWWVLAGMALLAAVGLLTAILLDRGASRQPPSKDTRDWRRGRSRVRLRAAHPLPSSFLPASYSLSTASRAHRSR